MRIAAPALTALAIAAAAQGASAADHEVRMAGSQYSPATLSVAVGDTIRFVNDDSADHNVFVPTAEFAFDLGLQEPGVVTSYTVRKAGMFEVECVIHPHMLSTVEVK